MKLRPPISSKTEIRTMPVPYSYADPYKVMADQQRAVAFPPGALEYAEQQREQAMERMRKPEMIHVPFIGMVPKES